MSATEAGRLRARGGAKDVDDDTDDKLRERLDELRLAHRDMDDAIARLGEAPFVDEIQMKRLKMRKLALKDTISRLESSLIPDLGA